ncbi:putative tail fiber protein [Pseudomonas phage Ep4]|uniref:Tail fiber protein n=1 Tax=Pseudomonas phage Ep4 TaxID=3057492 RepID=A0AAU9EG47_9CAUD|nr:putative tail fiber protein [Pseudomonas phage Ep4]
MLATQTAVSDGTLNVLAVGIPFFEQSDISITLDEGVALSLGVDYRWSTAKTVQFLSTLNTPSGLVPAGVVVRVYRRTELDAMLNLYDGGAPFNRGTLDENFLQLLFLLQEQAEGLGLTPLQVALNMNGFPITGLGLAPDDPTAALSKQAADPLYYNVSGDTLAGPMQVAGNQVTGLRVPVGPTEAARKQELDAEASSRAAADAALQAQLTEGALPANSQFSVISWHPQVIPNSVTIPDNVNAWSFGPRMEIAAGQVVTVGGGSFWTIANGATADAGPLTSQVPAPLDFGSL